jgi:hypothetical protein
VSVDVVTELGSGSGPPGYPPVRPRDRWSTAQRNSRLDRGQRGCRGPALGGAFGGCVGAVIAFRLIAEAQRSTKPLPHRQHSATASPTSARTEAVEHTAPRASV